MKLRPLHIPTITLDDLRRRGGRLPPDRLELAVLVVLAMIIGYQLFVEPSWG